MAEKRPSLNVLSGPLSGRKLVLEDAVDNILIGSDPSCGFVLDTPGVSPIHARLWVDLNGATVYDTNSPNGVYVNDDRVVKEAAVRNGDILWLGPPGEEGSVLIQCILPPPPPPPPAEGSPGPAAATPPPLPRATAPPPPAVPEFSEFEEDMEPTVVDVPAPTVARAAAPPPVPAPPAPPPAGRATAPAIKEDDAVDAATVMYRRLAAPPSPPEPAPPAAAPAPPRAAPPPAAAPKSAPAPGAPPRPPAPARPPPPKAPPAARPAAPAPRPPGPR